MFNVTGTEISNFQCHSVTQPAALLTLRISSGLKLQELCRSLHNIEHEQAIAGLTAVTD